MNFLTKVKNRQKNHQKSGDFDKKKSPKELKNRQNGDKLPYLVTLSRKYSF